MPKTFDVSVKNGMLAPSVDAIRQVMSQIRQQAEKDKTLRDRWKKDARGVLADAGFNRIVQNQILEEEGRRVRWRKHEMELASGCYGCSGCCCSGCSYSG